VAKSNLQYFKADWSKTVNWAATQGIPKTAWYPVYQLDLQRYANGEYPMSQAERARAILSASNLQANTVLPSDHPSPTNVFENTVSDLRNIFTGLEPTKLIGNIFDEVKNTFEHPQWLADPTKNTLMQWLPGWADYGEFKAGGISNVLSHPLVSFLDVMPGAKFWSRGLSKIGATAGLADRLGTSTAALGELGGLRLAGKALSAHQIGRAGARILGSDAELPSPAVLHSRLEALTGRQGRILKPLTVGERWKQFARSKGLSSEQSNVMAAVLRENHQQTQIHIELAKPFYNSLAKLSGPEQRQLYDLLQKSGREYIQLLNDDSIPVNIRQAIRNYEPIEQWFNEMVLSSERFAPIVMPDGSVEQYQNTPSNPVLKARNRADHALDTLSKQAAKSDAIAAQIQHADSQSQPYVAQLRDLQKALYAATKSNGADTAATEGAGLLNADVAGRFFLNDRANFYQVRALAEIIGPGGLVEQIEQARLNGDFHMFRAATLKLVRRFRQKSFTDLGPELTTVRQLADQLYAYAKYRVNLADQFDAEFHGRASKNFLGSTATLQKQATKAITDFERTVFEHPPSRFRPAYLDAYVSNLLKHERGAEVLDRAAELLGKKGAPTSSLEAVRSDPRTLYELISQYSKASSTDPLSQLISPHMHMEIRRSALEEVQRLRAEGFVPHYIPTVHPSDVGDFTTYNVNISTYHLPTVDAGFERLFDFTPTIYDIGASTAKGIKQVLARDGTIDFIDNDLKQFLYPVQDLLDLYHREYPLTAATDVGNRGAHQDEVLARDWNLQKFDPESIFGITSATVSKDAFYINKDLAKALKQALDRGQQLDKSLWGKSTNIFRTSILGYSPRFIAHIIFGGGFLLALRSSPYVFKYIGDAYRMAKAGDHEVLRGASTQVGADPVRSQIIEGFRKGTSHAAIEAADKTFHWWGGVKMRNLIMHEMMDKLNLDPSKISSWFKVLPAFTFKLTNFVTNMQRSIAYLDGMAHAQRRGWILDEAGNKVAITPERAREEGMRAAERALGDLRQMTPLERNTFTKIMPFYGWTKHILRYVSSYPMDHPYRAMFLSNLAEMNSEQVPSALPTRIQLLFFLGSPNSDGTVNTLDLRALDPLRDTANYATLSGLLSTLNPVFTAPFAMIDPSIVFGDNVLYPSLTYDQLYGTKVAAPAGNILTAAEQYVPQIGALDVALGLSAQYRGLRQYDPSGFSKLIFTDLGIPFTPEQINVKQIAAKGEIDRYQQAAQAAQSAWQTGDFSQIAGYPTVPDPQQPDYNITPMALEEQYKRILAATGQPPAEVTPSLPAPNI
jgi:hypothetical protein